MSNYTNKETAINCVQGSLGIAHDNLYRAKVAFRKYSPSALTIKYGQSENTPEDILKGYHEKVNELEANFNWLKSL